MPQGPAFDGDAKLQGGRVFTWIHRMLREREAGTPSIGGGGSANAGALL